MIRTRPTRSYKSGKSNRPTNANEAHTCDYAGPRGILPTATEYCLGQVFWCYEHAPAQAHLPHSRAIGQRTTVQLSVVRRSTVPNHSSTAPALSKVLKTLGHNAVVRISIVTPPAASQKLSSSQLRMASHCKFLRFGSCSHDALLFRRRSPRRTRTRR